MQVTLYSSYPLEKNDFLIHCCAQSVRGRHFATDQKQKAQQLGPNNNKNKTFLSFAYRVFHASSDCNLNKTLVAFKCANPSAERMETKTWSRSRAAGSVSDTTAVTVRRAVKRFLPPTRDPHSVPSSACMPEHALYTSDGRNLASPNKRLDKEKQRIMYKTRHWQTLSKKVGSYLFLYLR